MNCEKMWMQNVDSLLFILYILEYISVVDQCSTTTISTHNILKTVLAQHHLSYHLFCLKPSLSFSKHPCLLFFTNS